MPIVETQTFALKLLTDLFNRVKNTAGDLLIDQNLLGQDHLPKIWNTVFSVDHLKLGSIQVDAQDTSTGNFTVKGKIDLIPFQNKGIQLQNLGVQIQFFASKDSNKPTETVIECIVDFQGLPTEWDILSLYPYLPPFMNYQTDMLAEGAQESFLRKISFQDIQTRFSSYDFWRVRNEEAETPGLQLLTTLPSDPTLGLELLRAGFNFSSTIVADGDFWGEVKLIQPDLNKLTVFGVAGVDDQGSGNVLIGHSLQDPTTQQYPSLSIGGLKIELRRLCIYSGLENISGAPPGFFFEVYLGPEGGGLELIVQTGIGSTSARILGIFDKGITLSEVESLLGLSNLAQMLPAGHELGQLTLNYLELGISISPMRLDTLEFHITTEKPISVFHDKVEITPTLIWNRYYPQGSDSPTSTLSIAGDWILGGTEFYTSLDPSSGGFFVTMKADQSLNAAELINRFFSTKELPDIDIVDFELDGNFKDSSFSFEIDCTTDWEIDFGGNLPVVFSQLGIQGEYAPPDEDSSGDPTTTGSIVGILLIGNWNLDVEIDWGTSLSIEVQIPQINVTWLIDQLLHEIHIPIELPDFMIQNLDVKITPKTKEFTIQGGSSDTIDFFSGLDLKINSFQAQRKLSDPTNGIYSSTASISITLDVGGVGLVLSGTYDSSISSQNGKPSTEWNFKLQQQNTPIPFGKLIEKFGNWIGIDLPMWVGDLNLQQFYLEFNIGAANKYFITSGAVYDGTAMLGRFSLFAEKNDSTDTYLGSVQDYLTSINSGTYQSAPDTYWDYILDFEVEINIDAANFPLVGSEINSIQAMKLQSIACAIASRKFTQDEITTLVNRLPQGALIPPVKDIDKGKNFSTHIQLGSSVLSLAMPLDGPSAGGAGNNFPVNPASPLQPNYPITPAQRSTVDKTKWFALNVHLGSVTLQRIGVRFENSKVTFLLDAFLSLGGIEIGLAGLGVTSPFDHFQPSFMLEGLSVTYSNPPVTIGGGFLKAAEGLYEGQAILGLTQFELSALGAYSNRNGTVSFFVYLDYSEPLGGPPYFYVMGLAGGFGYNFTLNVPGVDQIRNFPFVQIAEGSESSANSDPVAMLQYLDENRITVPKSGEYWFAAGIRFLTFQMIDSFALATAQLGDHFELDLVGLSTLTIPQGVSNPIAEAQMALKASFDPQNGFFGISAQLTPSSYILSKDCHLTGGFAYFVWLGGDHAGDFVVTFGGYHPSFQVPAHYPNVPRLGIYWQIGSNISIQGYSYFALTPGYLMAGGGLEAVWSCGNLSAWFSAYVDFLLRWKPFHYDADCGVDIGVSYRFSIDLLFYTIHITITVHIGADIHFWGPDFSGIAKIHLWIVSFSISFGDSGQHPDPIKWSEFKTSFLPQQDGQTRGFEISATSGIVKDLSKDTSSKVQWVINPHTLSLSFATSIPLRKTSFGKDTLTSENPAFGIAPMDRKSTDILNSAASITITRDGESAEGDFVLDPLYKNVPDSLWGQSISADLNSKAVLSGILMGYEISPKPIPNPAVTSNIPLFRLEFADDPIQNAYVWETVTEPNIGNLNPEQRRDKIIGTISQTAHSRSDLFSAFGFVPDDFDLSNLSKGSDNAFLTPPKIYS
ncbi:hypothetical protein LEP1GSC058_0062 [Leptospira fainei serovar Hurstbridge str. BUT 6]|uniref:DUF6603 domain-containing protein n=1 Tax=Leptospira fainei serovar Hurstbridge str. BUT 6 TaxID=1193011 RepID=S3UXG7_9LEPT|nr:DUF6603 domain-containing protein [Leptospira fainei]EPG75066.1 hypothetical protein LEP1GSC058_0062 [Leptospira fainei serovar Hurstbridge str. BUT 6]